LKNRARGKLRKVFFPARNFIKKPFKTYQKHLDLRIFTRKNTRIARFLISKRLKTPHFQYFSVKIRKKSQQINKKR